MHHRRIEIKCKSCRRLSPLLGVIWKDSHNFSSPWLSAYLNPDHHMRTASERASGVGRVCSMDSALVSHVTLQNFRKFAIGLAEWGLVNKWIERMKSIEDNQTVITREIRGSQFPTTIYLLFRLIGELFALFRPIWYYSLFWFSRHCHFIVTFSIFIQKIWTPVYNDEYFFQGGGGWGRGEEERPW